MAVDRLVFIVVHANDVGVMHSTYTIFTPRIVGDHLPHDNRASGLGLLALNLLGFNVHRVVDEQARRAANQLTQRHTSLRRGSVWKHTHRHGFQSLELVGDTFGEALLTAARR
ncbi:hypothetical protein D3C84_857220 [compost metagenome]